MSSTSWDDYLDGALEQLKVSQRFRRRDAQRAVGVIDFGTNDYLGLRSHPGLLATLVALGTKPDSPESVWGSGASSVLSGYTLQHQAFEQALAAWSHVPAALVFSSGFAGHAGCIACLAGDEDLILSDRWNHASLIDGCRLSRAQSLVYPHADVEFVRTTLHHRRSQFRKVLVLTESLFSMDGDIAPLSELAELCQRFDCGLVVDEAHAIGVYGATGAGVSEELSLQPQLLLKLGTMSKGLGSVGGYAAGAENIIEYLVNRCRSYLFSTAPPAAVMAVTQQALQLLQSMHGERRQLRAAASWLRQELHQQGWAVPAGDSPIIPLLVGSEARALEISQQLRVRGLSVPAIRPPTVPVGTCRLRISLSIRHTPADLRQLVDSLGELVGHNLPEP